MIHVQEIYYFVLMYQTLKVRKIFNVIKILRLVSWVSKQPFCGFIFSPVTKSLSEPIRFHCALIYHDCLSIIIAFPSNLW